MLPEILVEDPGRDGKIDEAPGILRAAEEMESQIEAALLPEWDEPIPLDGFNPPPIPRDIYPAPLAEFCEQVAESTQTPIDLAMMLALSVIATAGQKKAQVQVGRDWSEPLNVWTVSVLPPGERKSAVCREMTEPLSKHEADEAERLGPSIREALERKNLADARVENLRAKCRNGKADINEVLEAASESAGIQVPHARRLLADDVTPERLAGLMSENGGAISVISPEADIIAQMGGRYSANGAPNLGVFLKAHAGDRIVVDRMKRAPERVENPALTLGLTVQPDVTNGLIHQRGFRGQGLIARFAFSLPTSMKGSRNCSPPAVTPESREAYHFMVARLLRWAPAETQVLPLSRPAQEELLAFQERLEPQLGPTGALSHIADWAAKLAGLAVRIAGLLHLAQVGCAGCAGFALYTGEIDLSLSLGEIAPSTMRKAIRLAEEYLLPHASAAFAAMGASSTAEAARHIWQWLSTKAPERISKRDLFDATRSRFQKVSEMDEPLAYLVERGYLREEPRPPAPPRGGRPPSPVYLLNPRALTRTTRTTRTTLEGGAEIPAAQGIPLSKPGPAELPQNPRKTPAEPPVDADQDFRLPEIPF